ncbi:MAG: PIN domain-containing protein [Candidatus Jordarchaeaceae archaeon]
MRFVDAPVFIKWMSASTKGLSLEAAISGYILYRIENMEPAATTTIVKDEVLIWLSHYKANALPIFIKALRSLYSLDIIPPTLEDQENAYNMYGKLFLGLSDLISSAVMKRLNLTEICTPDEGFEKSGFKAVFYELAETDDFREFTDFLKNKNYNLAF